MLRGFRAGSQPERRVEPPIDPPPGPPPSFATVRATATSSAASKAQVGVGALATARSSAGTQVRTRCTAKARSSAQGQFRPRCLAIARSSAGAAADSTPAFYNGYYNYIDVVVPKESIRGTANLINYSLLLIGTNAEFKTKGNGGFIEHPFGYDVQIEKFSALTDTSGGTVLDYARVDWEGVQGFYQYRVLVPTLTAGVDNFFRIYYGNPNISVDQAKPRGAYAAYLLNLDCETGEDLTGNGRDFSATNVDLGFLVGSAGDYNGLTSLMEIAALPLAFNGLSAITLEAWIIPSATPNGVIFASGPVGATAETQMGMTLAYNDPGVAAGAVKTIGFKLEVQTAPGVSGAARVEGPANCQAATGDAQYVVGVWQSGQVAKLLINGLAVVPSNVPIARTGTTLIERG